MKTNEMPIQELLMWMLDHDPKAAGIIAHQANYLMNDFAWFANWKHGETDVTVMDVSESHAIYPQDTAGKIFDRARAIHLANDDRYKVVRLEVTWRKGEVFQYIYVPKQATLIGRNKDTSYSVWFRHPDQTEISRPGQLQPHAILPINDTVASEEEETQSVDELTFA